MTFKNTFGHVFQIHSFGESHGVGLGVVIEGCPAGLEIDEKWLHAYMARRRPGQNAFVTSRNEADEFEILSGILQKKTLGTPIAILFRNHNQRSEDYQNLKPRQGHADQTWTEKFSHVDLRGGGRSSGRETISRVAGGAIARNLLDILNPQLKIQVWVQQVGDIVNTLNYSDFEARFDKYEGLKEELSFPDAHQVSVLKERLAQAKEMGESYGGKIQIRISGLEAGLGQPVFSKLKSDMAAALFSIGAVNSVSLGDEDVFQKGTLYHAQKSAYGGVQGGISSGEDITMNVLFKPTSSILDVAKQGRHDPCILPRAVVVVESMLALVLADHHLLKRMDNIEVR